MGCTPHAECNKEMVPNLPNDPDTLRTRNISCFRLHWWKAADTVAAAKKRARNDAKVPDDIDMGYFNALIEKMEMEAANEKRPEKKARLDESVLKE